MKRFFLAMCVSMAMVITVAPAYAMELWPPHLPGVDEGLAAGALPPAGFYFINDSYFATDFKAYDYKGNAAAQTKLTGSYVDVPILIWSTGCKFLNADYAMGIAQPFDQTTLRAGTSSIGPLGYESAVTGAQWGTFNTVLIPLALSWKIPCDFRVKFAFAIGVDDAWTSVNDSLASIAPHLYGNKLLDHSGPNNTPINAYAWSGLGEWFFTPNVGISWLHAGWNLSADFWYTWSMKATDADIQSGGMFQADYTATYTCGKWTFGVGATQNLQVDQDKGVFLNGAGVPVYGSIAHSIETKYAVGPILGYNFGPCSLMLVYNWGVDQQNCVAGNFLNARLVIPLGNPYPLGK